MALSVLPVQQINMSLNC